MEKYLILFKSKKLTLKCTRLTENILKMLVYDIARRER